MHNPNHIDFFMIFIILVLVSVLIGVGWIIATSDLPPWFKFTLLS